MIFEEQHLRSCSRPWNRCFSEFSIFLHIRLIRMGKSVMVLPCESSNAYDLGCGYGIKRASHALERVCV